MRTTFGGSQIHTKQACQLIGLSTKLLMARTTVTLTWASARVLAHFIKRKAQKSEVAKLYSAEDFFHFLKQKMTYPKKTIFQKKGVGVYRRVFHFVPISGDLSVDRKIQKCETVKGTKKLHEICNIGQEGFIQTRLASCFDCQACASNLPDECKNIVSDRC
jgi:hypothetical protein